MPDAFAPGSGALDFDANSLTELILKPLYKADANKDTLTLKFLVDNAHSAAVSHTRGRKNAFTLLSNHIDEALQQSYWCLWNAKTPQRLVYGLFTSLSLLDLKEFTLLNFAYMLRYALNGSKKYFVTKYCCVVAKIHYYFLFSFYINLQIYL